MLDGFLFGGVAWVFGTVDCSAWGVLICCGLVAELCLVYWL